jgi:hypothetical protein
VYQPYVMLRNLAPRDMTRGEQREADEQLGQLAAAVARWGDRVAARSRRILRGRMGRWPGESSAPPVGVPAARTTMRV